MHTFKFKILTPDQILFDKEIVSATLPTMEGEITILANHIPLVSAMSIGQVMVRLADGSEERFDLQGGVLNVQAGGAGATLMSDTYIDTGNINELELQAEIDRAKVAMNEAVDENAFAELEGNLERNLYLRKVLSKRK
jgi:F-type H+-transporting ATPase subunit epsilon